MSSKQTLPKVINHIENSEIELNSLQFATRNKGKLEEFERILKTNVIGVDLKVEEIQSEDPLKVLEQKAKDAWIANKGRPIIVEDSALICKGFDNLPGTFADQFTNTIVKREALCKILKDKNRDVIFQVGLAIFDGNEAQTRIGQVPGKIADKPTGPYGFGFDDIFIPNSHDKTFGEMERPEKDKYSPRRIALEQLLKEPFIIGRHIFELPPPYQLQIDAIKIEKLKNKKTLQYAYALEQLEGNIPKEDFSIKAVRPYREISYVKGQIKRIIANKNSASLGIILTPMDTATDLYGNSLRLKTDQFGNPVFWQMSNSAIKMALAARASEFSFYHNEKMYTYIRDLIGGKIKTTPRANRKSDAIEALLKIKRLDESYEVLGTAAISELGYARMSSDAIMSRTESAGKGLILNSTGIPSSIFSLGGMPPTTGWRDVLVTSALSFMRSYIPRNSIYAGNLKLQLELFRQAKDQIEKLDLPKDIEQIVIKQIGIAIGCEDPKKIASDAQEIYKAGCSSVRFYTTNPDRRLADAAEAIKQKVGDSITICVAPIVDIKQASQLIKPNIKTDILIAGHGGGENCTSLAGGGAANSLELLYSMYLNPEFNQTAIGLEGGTGNAIGAILGMVDAILLNKRGVNGGIETGGLFVEHINGRVCQPYHGSASPITQWIESALNKDIASKRLNDAGRLRNVEGKANYMFKRRSVHSIVDNFQEARMYAGRALADQNARSIYELREKIKKFGHTNHCIVSNAAAYVASAHRAIK